VLASSADQAFCGVLGCHAARSRALVRVRVAPRIASRRRRAVAEWREPPTSGSAMAEIFESKARGRKPIKPKNSDTRNPRKAADKPGTFSDELQLVLMRFKEGEFRARMPANYVGMEGKLADLLNEILAVSDRRATEITRICRVVGK